MSEAEAVAMMEKPDAKASSIGDDEIVPKLATSSSSGDDDIVPKLTTKEAKPSLNDAGLET